MDNRNDSIPDYSTQFALPEAYKLESGALRSAIAPDGPKVIYIEVTNRCNLRCNTCVRSFQTREPRKDLALREFEAIIEQFPRMKRAVLHGIGEPLFNWELPKMIQLLKGRHIEVLFNSNGTMLTRAWQEKLVRSELDEYRCSIDAATPATYVAMRNRDLLSRIVTNLEGLEKTKARLGATHPVISLSAVVTRENIADIPGLVRLAAQIGVGAVYIHRLVFLVQESEQQFGLARQSESVFGNLDATQENAIVEATALASELGIKLRASGASHPINSLKGPQIRDSAPWKECLRPWTSAYITANGNCLPCCISPLATNGYDRLIMGNIFAQPFSDIWNSAAYQNWRTDLLSVQPPGPCTGCGVSWSL